MDGFQLAHKYHFSYYGIFINSFVNFRTGQTDQNLSNEISQMVTGNERRCLSLQIKFRYVQYLIL